MFNWFKKKEIIVEKEAHHDCYDEIEQSLWEIKEEYDLPTEEVTAMVHSKRRNLSYMYEKLSLKKK